MRLVIREYLSMIKESEELDVLLPDLLLAMGINPISRPGKGSRQKGVDILAVGVDKDNLQKLFLLTVKRGDITRSMWDKTGDGVHASLNELRVGYLRTRVRPEHEGLPKKIILATGGELKSNVQENWTDYVHEYAGVHQRYGNIEFDFWGGDQLAPLIEQYLLDEYLFPESAQKHLRKTIALADQNEDEPRYFYALIEETLFERELPKEKDRKAERKRQKALCLLNLSLNIVFHWCQEADNLRPALLCAERTVLRTWDWMRQNELFDCKITYKNFTQLFFTYLKVTHAYAAKLQSRCFVRDGLFVYGVDDELEYPLRTFEVIGILGLLGVVLAELAVVTQDKEISESYHKQMQVVAQMLAALIENNPPASTPRYDSHAIDIALGLLTLTVAGYTDQAAQWLEVLSMCIVRAYQIGKYFPISSDSYDDLVEMVVDQAFPKEKLMQISTLLPMLAHWYAVLDLGDPYRLFQEAVTKTFTKTNLQLWFPDEDTDTYFYSTNAGFASGVTLPSIRLPETLDDLKVHILRLREKDQAFNNLSCIIHGWSVLGLIASRHFRTPVTSAYWRNFARDTTVRTS